MNVLCFEEEVQETSAFLLIKCVQGPELRSCRCSGPLEHWLLVSAEKGDCRAQTAGPQSYTWYCQSWRQGKKSPIYAPGTRPSGDPECHFWSHGLLLYSWT